jgi:hypothetical protein
MRATTRRKVARRAGPAFITRVAETVVRAARGVAVEAATIVERAIALRPEVAARPVAVGGAITIRSITARARALRRALVACAVSRAGVAAAVWTVEVAALLALRATAPLTAAPPTRVATRAVVAALRRAALAFVAATFAPGGRAIRRAAIHRRTLVVVAARAA